MSENKLPWTLRSSDFYKIGWHIRPTIAYELMFEFLRLSPSYEMARKASAKELTQEQKAQLPEDFDRVLATYALLGDVQKILFRQWWVQRGLKVFGNPNSSSKVRKVAELKFGQLLEANDLSADINSYMNGARQEEGLQPTVLIAMPLGLSKAEYRKQLDKIMSELSISNADAIPQAKIKLQGKRLRAKVLFSGIKLLWFRAAKPSWQEWRLGAKSGYSKSYSKELNPDNPRKTYGTVESYDREMMTKITHRALKKFEAIAENAARGKFPSEEPVDKMDFNYKVLVKRIQAKNAWEKAEKARLLARYNIKNKLAE